MSEEPNATAGGGGAQSSPKLLEVPQGVPTFFVDGAQGITIINDVVKISFFQVVQKLPENVAENLEGGDFHQREVVLRLALSPVTLIQFIEWLKVAFPYKLEADPESKLGPLS